MRSPALSGPHASGGQRCIVGKRGVVLPIALVVCTMLASGCSGDADPLDRPEVFRPPEQRVAQRTDPATSPTDAGTGTAGTGTTGIGTAGNASDSGTTGMGGTAPGTNPPATGGSSGTSSGGASSGATGSSDPSTAHPGGGSATPGSSPGTGNGNAPVVEPPRLGPLPADLGAWTDDDFRRARRQSDPRLPQAIRLHAARRTDDPRAAELWIELLRMRPEASPQGGTPTPDAPNQSDASEPSRSATADDATRAADAPVPSGAADESAPDAAAAPSSATAEASGDVIRALIEALTGNRAPAARDAMRHVLTGELTTELPPADVVSYLADALLRSGDAQHTALLVESLVRPQVFRPAEGPFSWARLQQAALLAVGRRPSRALYRQIAEAVDDPSSPHVAAVIEALLEPGEDRLEAQWVLLVRGGLGAAEQSRARRILAHYSSAALRQLLGIPAARRDPAASDTPGEDPQAAVVEIPPDAPADAPPAAISPLPTIRSLDAATLAWIVRDVWNSDALLATVERDVRHWRGFAQDDSQLALAAAIPHSRIRRAVREVIRTQWPQGPGTLLEQSGLLADPGLLAVVKTAPREPRLALRPGSTAATPPAEPVSPDKPVSPAVARAMKEREMRREWMDATERLMRLWMKRCAAVAQPPKEGRMDMPVRLFEDTTAVAYYRAALPEAATAHLGGVPPGGQAPWLVLHYARVEEKQLHSSESGRRFLHYQRQAKTDTRYAVTDGYWCESVTPLRDSRHLLCVDVLFTTPTADAAADATGQPPVRQDWVTEILVIEIPDYVFE